MGKGVFYFKLAAALLAIVAVAVYFYTSRLSEEVENNALLAIEEISRHDRRAIDARVEFFFVSLRDAAEILRAADLRAADIGGALRMRARAARFENLVLAAKDGTLYESEGAGPEVAREVGELLDYGEADGSRFNKAGEARDFSRDVLLFAVKLDNFVVAGVPMEALAGTASPAYLGDFLIGDSFVKNGEPYGFGSVIDAAGNYILGDPYGRGGRSGNFFSRLAMAEDASLTKREIQTRMKENEAFHFYMEDASGEKLIYFAPLSQGDADRPDWYFVITADNGYLLERQGIFLLTSGSLLALSLLIFAGAAIYGAIAGGRARAAEEKARVRGDFLASMSHEIRTPLNGIMGLNYLVAKNIGDPERLPKVKAWLAKSRILGEYLHSLLNDVIDISQLRAGRVKTASEPYSVSRLMHDVAFMHSASAEKKNIQIIPRQNIIWPRIRGDEARVKQILNNLMHNAIKFTGSGGSVTLSVEQKKLDDGRTFTIWSCADTGPGISEAFMDKIFDPFAKENAVAPESSLPAAGLGLPISKDLATAMGGSLTCESNPGKGSVFTLSLPCAVVGDPHRADEVPNPEPAAIGNRKILVVEDAEFNAEFLLDVLKDEGFDVVLATNGREAADIFAASEPGEYAIILMDLEMPVMDGCEAARAIRALKREDAGTVLIYAVTANAFEDDRRDALASGMDDFLTKPLNIHKFARKINERFKGRRRG